jgi:hypothetical protein
MALEKNGGSVTRNPPRDLPGIVGARNYDVPARAEL